MKKLVVFIGILLGFIGCNKEYAPLDTVKKVELDKYLGTWYEIARYPNSFEEGCSDVTANYALKDDGDIKVTNTCVKEGKENDAIGVAYATNVENTKLKVSFFRPFYGDYWIIMLGEDYSYAVVGNPSREYLWILARTSKLPQDVVDMIVKKLPSFGYSEDKLIWTPQAKN